MYLDVWILVYIHVGPRSLEHSGQGTRLDGLRQELRLHRTAGLSSSSEKHQVCS